MKRKNLYFIFIILFPFFLLDQITKILVVKNLDYGSSITIVPSFFKLTYVQNTGAAWSMFTGNQLFLIFMSIVVFLFFLFYVSKKEEIGKGEAFIYGMLLGGIFGNLIDRIRLNYVIDFFDFDFFHYHFPVFNMADIFIVLSGLLLVIKIFKEGDTHDV